MVPTRKVAVGAFAGFVVVIAAWASRVYAKVEIPAEVGMAIQGVITFALQWFVPDAPSADGEGAGEA